MKLPLRLSILNTLKDKQSYNAEKIFHVLKKDYIKEGQFHQKGIENHLSALESSGLIKREKTTNFFFITIEGEKRL